MFLLLKGRKLTRKRIQPLKWSPLLQKNTGRITEADFVRFLLNGAKIAPNKNPAFNRSSFLEKNTGRITEADFLRFLLKGVKISTNKNPASKMTSFVTEEHWTNFEGWFREVPAAGCEIAPNKNPASKLPSLLQKNTGRITEADFVRFLLNGAKISPNMNPASKITFFVSEKHWTNYGARFREVPAEGGRKLPRIQIQPLKDLLCYRRTLDESRRPISWGSCWRGRKLPLRRRPASSRRSTASILQTLLDVVSLSPPSRLEDMLIFVVFNANRQLQEIVIVFPTSVQNLKLTL